MAIDEMLCEEKHNKIFEVNLSEMAGTYTFHKEQGTVNIWLESTLVFSGSITKFMDPIIKLMKTIAPRRTFKQTAD